MDGYVQVVLKSYLDVVGEDETKKLLSSFSCPQNADVESFLHDKAIEFAKQGIAQTHLVFCSYKGTPELIGYYALTMKTVQVKRSVLSESKRKKIAKFANFDKEARSYFLPCPLIAQLGKNFRNGLNNMITGNELLALACNKVAETQLLMGGKIVYLECEDINRLRDFYRRNGFFEFGKRTLDREEKSLLHGEYLIQMLKYLK